MRAKSHDQRKGQWLINKIRNGLDFPKLEFTGTETYEELDKIFQDQKTLIELRIWNMENDEFDRLMGDYYK
ncbi:hypothetical protein [Nitrososphaeria virus YSH_922147]|uniref:Uncharacterized protein n=1 Tax=Nitrososphaeria virus YSH_922147 TaxID=3071323 RepID=A0A976UBI9_9CAUD|nr:hypothetical protein QKV94_gp56 [Yangshan Harbor Nitrososphaeria virus]UVF62465.1 hypothetical protein [Nitrososphaeria virus YSH_922147]